MSAAYQLDLLALPPSLRPADDEDPPDGSTDEWFTLDEDWEPLHREFGFDLDVFSTHENAKCARHFTLAEDGLKQSWEGARVWDNAPYSDLPRCTTKARNEILRAELVVQDLPVWTDRRWYHQNIEPFRVAGLLEVRFSPKRRRFGWPGMPQGARGRSATFASMFVVMRATTALRDAVKRAIEAEGWECQP
jgi:site-specific DNA-methyltransferase (adenine-specific)